MDTPDPQIPPTFEDEVAWAKEFFADYTGNDFNPMARLHGVKDDKPALGLILLAVEGLSKWEGLAEVVRDFKATYVVFMSDMWYCEYSEQKEARDPLVPPSKNPNRKEAFGIIVFSSEGVRHSFLPYHREDDKVIWDEPMHTEEALIESEGEMLVLAALS